MMYNPLEGMELCRENVAPGSPQPFIPLKRESKKCGQGRSASHTLKSLEEKHG